MILLKKERVNINYSDCGCASNIFLKQPDKRYSGESELTACIASLSRKLVKRLSILLENH
jgi:hypothetical protein